MHHTNKDGFNISRMLQPKKQSLNLLHIISYDGHRANITVCYREENSDASCQITEISIDITAHYTRKQSPAYSILNCRIRTDITVCYSRKNSPFAIRIVKYSTKAHVHILEVLMSSVDQIIREKRRKIKANQEEEIRSDFESS